MGRKIQLCAVWLIGRRRRRGLSATVLKIKVQANELRAGGCDPAGSSCRGPRSSRVEPVDFSSSPFVTGHVAARRPRPFRLAPVRSRSGIASTGRSVEGAPVSQRCGTMAAADFLQRQLSPVLDFREWTFLNADPYREFFAENLPATGFCSTPNPGSARWSGARHGAAGRRARLFRRAIQTLVIEKALTGCRLYPGRTAWKRPALVERRSPRSCARRCDRNGRN
jgi:hypothetical protein